MSFFKNKDWFKTWFNCSYYHILYKNRNYKEAEKFIDKLIDYLQPNENAKFLDLGCGKGRHSIYLNTKNFSVTGIDLSPESIEYAKQFENEKLKFYVHDMRKVFRENYFDAVLNLFTSFGYFENEEDDLATINAVNKALQPNGYFVLDFMNSKKVIENIDFSEIKNIDGIDFHIHKKIENKFIVKQISFTDKGKNYKFEECVKLISLADFEKYFSANKLKIVDLRGNYNLDKFDENTSDRLILIAKK